MKPNIKKEGREIAYFSMEVGLTSDMPTYSGGLGVLAGDTIKSFVDLKVPAVAVSLVYNKGFFRQSIDEEGNQHEKEDDWDKNRFLTLLPNKVSVTIENRNVQIQCWEYMAKSDTGYFVPVYFLDTDVEGNDDYDRTLTHWLYGGDKRYRFHQEMVLGIGGVRMLKELGYSASKFHMNEGHSALLILELLNETMSDIEQDYEKKYDFETVKEMCVFTTHTPVPAGHDSFDMDMVNNSLGDFYPMDKLESNRDGKLCMTYLALNHSSYINGVAKKHGEVSRHMFPGYQIDSITNGVHSKSWVCDSFQKLFDLHLPGWGKDPYNLRYALSISNEEIWNAHILAKTQLMDYIRDTQGIELDTSIMTIGFARRSTQYKRADLIFNNIEKLMDVEKNGQIQIIYAGKAHPNDSGGKEIIKRIVEIGKRISDRIKVVYLPDYKISLGKILISGVDLWLNTPKRPLEASGTSGMKAMHNGVPNLSILDGWWIEGCIEGETGWSIGPLITSHEQENDDIQDSDDLYYKLKDIIIPMYYNDRNRWIRIMKHCIAFNASFFNTHRMVQQYVINAYF
ncbi:alpha-glucan family phosphorylase [Candidatus Woesearchaeota archaeon]|nr:alpha-glucan family phosphorylase [Candidatus Woesearchaeota archaeon]